MTTAATLPDTDLETPDVPAADPDLEPDLDQFPEFDIFVRLDEGTPKVALAPATPADAPRLYRARRDAAGSAKAALEVAKLAYYRDGLGRAVRDAEARLEKAEQEAAKARAEVARLGTAWKDALLAGDIPDPIETERREAELQAKELEGRLPLLRQLAADTRERVKPGLLAQLGETLDAMEPISRGEQQEALAALRKAVPGEVVKFVVAAATIAGIGIERNRLESYAAG